jgi:hypothetical protein
LQIQVHQHISRANFSAERGIRYGPDFYDARMQATQVCSITVPSLDTTTAVAGDVPQDESVVEGQKLDDVERDTAASRADGGSLKEGTASTAAAQYTEHGEALKGKRVDTACFTISTAPQKAQEKEVLSAGAEDSKKTKTAPKDPLRMFGLLTPPPLRLAQAESIKSVEEVIPKLVSIDAEMKEVEIRIRRARKWKVKAEAQDEKAADNAGQQGLGKAEKAQELMV